MRYMKTWVERRNTLSGSSGSSEDTARDSPIGRLLSNPRIASVTITYDTAIGGTRTYTRVEPLKEGK